MEALRREARALLAQLRLLPLVASEATTRSRSRLRPLPSRLEFVDSVYLCLSGTICYLCSSFFLILH